MRLTDPGGKKQHFGHLLFFAFHRSQKAAEAARDICMMYGEGVIGESTTGKWFAKFKNGNYGIDDTPRSGRPSEFDEDHLKALLKEESRQKNCELAEKMNCDQKTILNHFHSMEFAEKLGVWVPHELSENNKENRLQMASQHSPAIEQHAVTNSALYRIVTGDEKWCLYINMKQRKEWVAPGDTPKPRVKPDLHPRKTMICVWWDWEGMVHWEMLERNATVKKELYIAQLHRVNEAIRLKRPHRQGQTILLRDNARPHVAQVSKPHSKSSNGRSFSIRRILRTLHLRLLSFPLIIEPYEGRYLRE